MIHTHHAHAGRDPDQRIRGITAGFQEADADFAAEAVFGGDGAEGSGRVVWAGIRGVRSRMGGSVSGERGERDLRSREGEGGEERPGGEEGG